MRRFDREGRNAIEVLDRGHTKSDVARLPGVSLLPLTGAHCTHSVAVIFRPANRDRMGPEEGNLRDYCESEHGMDKLPRVLLPVFYQ